MKNIKRIAVLLAVILVAMSMILLMASCGGEETDETNKVESSTQNGGSSSTTGNNPGGTDNSSNNPGGTDNSGTDSSNNPGSGDTPGGDEQVNTQKVTVKVVDQNGKPLKGAEVQICEVGGNCYLTRIKTGEDGIGSHVYSQITESTQIKAKVLKVAGIEDYLAAHLDCYIGFNGTSREITITVRKIEATVFDQLGKAVEGASVQFKQGGLEFGDVVYTDADGVASAYVFINNQGISASVTEVNALSGKFELPSDEVTYGIGVYDETITINKLLSYSVEIKDLMGSSIKGAKVELFNSKNLKVETVYTNENGIAVFDDLESDSYYVKVSHVNNAYTFTTASDNGKYYFHENSNRLTIEAVETNATYTVTLSNGLVGATVIFFDGNNEICAETITDESGVAIVSAPNANYVVVVYMDADWNNISCVPVFFTRDGATSANITVNGVADGSMEKPYVSVDSVAFEVSGEKACVLVPLASKKLVKFSFDYEVWTLLDAAVSTEDGYSIYEIDTTGKEFVVVSSTIPGTAAAPIEIENENGSIAVDTTEEKMVYYTFTASKTGTLIITAPTGVSFAGDCVFADGYLYALNEGETIVFFSMVDKALLEDATNEVSFSYEFVADFEIGYNVLIEKEGEGAEGVTVTLYYRNGDTLEQIAQAVTDKDGAAAFGNICYNKNYVVKVGLVDGYTTLYEENEYGIETGMVIYLIQIKTGEVDLPFDFNVANEQELVSVPQNGAVWYSLLVRPNFDGTVFKLVANSTNAVIKVFYSDTDGNGIVDASDTPVGTSSVINGEVVYKFAENDKVYKIMVYTENGESEEFTLFYEAEEPNAGATVDNAIEIEGATVVDVAITDAPVYYRYTGSEGTLTVSVEGENVKLQMVVFDREGNVTYEDAENNTFTCVLDGTWVYFVVSSDFEITTSINVTVE